MKKLAILFSFLFLCTQVGYCATGEPEQTTQDNKAVISIQKQPTSETVAQKQKATRNIACIIIQVNGKVKE